MFKLDSPLMNFLGKVSDLMILNALIILCSLPIFTIGASITAAYSVAYKMVKHEESYMIKGFFKAFKANFKQSTAIWMIFLVIFAILFFDFRIILYSGMDIAKWIIVAIFAVTVFVAAGFSFVFPLQARFVNSVKHTIKNAFLMAITHLPSTILFVVSTAVPFAIAYFVPQIAPLVVLLGFALLPYLKSFLFLRIFKKYENDVESEQEETGEGIFAVSDAMEKMSEKEEKK